MVAACDANQFKCLEMNSIEVFIEKSSDFRIMKSSNFVCSVGPSNNSVERIERMIYKGMSVARLNLSHGAFEEHLQSISNVREAAGRVQERTNVYCPLAIAVDLRGPEIRTGKVETRVVEIGELVKLNDNPFKADILPPDIVHVDYSVADKLKKHFKIRIDDDIRLKVDDIFGDTVTCSVLKGGTLLSFQSVLIPDLVKHFRLPFVSDRDKACLEFAVENKVDFIFASHVECGEWIEQIREAVGVAGKDIKIFAKVQNRFGVDEIEEIASKFDGVIFAPTADIDSKLIPMIQRLVAQVCKAKMKPCLMTVDAELVAIEIYQLVNWSLDSCDGVVMTRGSAEGKSKPLESMQTLQNIRTIAKEFYDDSRFDEVSQVWGTFNALASACVTSSINTDAAAIIVLTESEKTAEFIHQLRPKCELIVVTRNPRKARQLNILDKVTPLLTEGGSGFQFAVNFAKKRGIVKDGDTVVVMTDKNMQIHYLPYE